MSLIPEDVETSKVEKDSSSSLENERTLLWIEMKAVANHK
jgi:hypothetical protein